MEIRRFISGAAAGDGGTISCRVELVDGTVVDLGLDCRIPKKKSERRIFIGAGYPTQPNAKILEKDGAEEAPVVSAIQAYVSCICVAELEARRKTDPGLLSESDQADLMAVSLLKAIHDRVDPPPRKSWLP